MTSEANELEQVRDRIVELEKLLAEKKKPPGTPLGMVALIMGGFLVTFGSMLAASLYITVGRTLLEEKLSPKPPTPVVAATGPANSFFPISKSPTIGLTLNTAEDFIAVFRNGNYGGVDVVAVDGSTFKPIWHAGPFTLLVDDPGATVLKRINQHVVLENGGNLWVINIRNGFLERALSASSTVKNVCAFEDGSSKANLDGDNQVIDLTTSPISLTPQAATETNNQRLINCDARGPFPLCGAQNFSFPCETDHTPPYSNIMPGSSITYESISHRFAVTRGGQGTGSFSATCSLKKAAQPTVIWQRELAAAGDEAKTKTEIATSFAGGQLLFGYHVDGSDIKVQAHNADGRSWLYQNKAWRSLKTITGTSTRVYVVLDDRLVVLAADKGTELTTIRAMP